MLTLTSVRFVSLLLLVLSSIVYNQIFLSIDLLSSWLQDNTEQDGELFANSFCVSYLQWLVVI
jgi:hypothetical protein